MKKLLSIMILVLFASVSFGQLGGYLTQKKADTRYAKNPSTIPIDTLEVLKSKLGVQTQTEADARYPLKSDSITASSILVLKADSSATAGKKYATGKMLKDGLALKTDLTAENDFIRGLKALNGTIISSCIFPIGYNPYSSNSAATMTSAREYFLTFYLFKSTVVTGYKFMVQTAGVYTADAVNGISIHSMASNSSTEVAGTKVTNADMWKSVGWNTVALSSPVTLAAGEYKVYCLYHQSAQTTAPILTGYQYNDLGNYTQNSFGGYNAVVGYMPSKTDLTSPQAFSGIYTATSNVPLIFLY